MPVYAYIYIIISCFMSIIDCSYKLQAIQNIVIGCYWSYLHQAISFFGVSRLPQITFTSRQDMANLRYPNMLFF